MFGNTSLKPNPRIDFKTLKTLFTACNVKVTDKDVETFKYNNW